jgi:RimJ/RimL family protein N-acetyltransferase
MSEFISTEVITKDGQKMIIRKPDSSDAEKMIEYLNIVGGESDNLLFGKDEFRLTVEQEIEHIKNMNQNTNGLMIIGCIGEKIASIAQISGEGRKRIAHNSEVAISVKKEYWGNGIGSAMMSALIHFAKETDKIKNISLGVKASNNTAMKLYEKMGFVKIGVHKNFFYIDGNFDDEILMDLSI